MSTTTQAIPVSPLRTVRTFGPFIDAGLVTAIPTQDFLEGIRDPNLTFLQIPELLLYVYRELEECVVDPWIFYLSMAMARQFSYCKWFDMRPEYKTSKLDNTNTTLYELYKAFYLSSNKAGRSFLKTGFVEIAEQNRLIEQERLLMLETFHRFPELFTKIIDANVELLQELVHLSSENHIKRVNDPEGLLETVQKRLESEWIRLDDAEHILGETPELYNTWLDLKEDKRTLEEHCYHLQKVLDERREEWMDVYAIAADGFRIWIDPRDRRSALETGCNKEPSLDD